MAGGGSRVSSLVVQVSDQQGAEKVSSQRRAII